ncbi:UNVERIFIED_CONTAM: hypothetical protein GTU68_016616 [Idotea baltica]|nr:hypothetical protein [Idotea baltica]
MSLLITGGTGFVGRRFLATIDETEVTAITRNTTSAQKTLGSLAQHFLPWPPDQESLSLPKDIQFKQVINLMGEPIAEGRWTAAKKKRIFDSRVLGTRKLVDGLLASGNPPEVFVSTSAIGIYGDSGEAIVDEDHAAAEDLFKSDLCAAWEAEAMRLADHGTRVVCLRLGIVLGDGGGALEKMMPIFKLGIGGKLGSGKQWMSWIHIDDLVNLINWSLQNDQAAGPINATAPNPVRNSDFTKALAAAVKRPAFLPAPWFALRAVFGEFANSLFYSQRVIPKAATELGFKFKFENIHPAISDVVQSANS